MDQPNISHLLTLPAASRALGVSDKQLRAAVDRGELEAVRLSDGGWPRIPEAALRAWLIRRRIGTR